MRIGVLFLIMIMCMSFLNQDIVPDKPIETGLIAFTPDSACQIFNQQMFLTDESGQLNTVFEKLYQLRCRKDSGKLVVMQVGDSHTQGGYQSGKIRQLFQEYFGNAGRGLIVPLRLGKTNQPDDYSITSDIEWESDRCIEKDNHFPIGTGGITLACSQNNFRLVVTLKGADSTANAFNQIKILNEGICFESENSALQMNNQDSAVFQSVNLQTSTSFSGKKTNNDAAKLYGVVLENNQPGILYHAIGINGAHFQDYTNHPEFFEASAKLNPNLIIIALGTNEAFGGRFIAAQFENQLHQMVEKIRTSNPGASVLLVTPAEVFIRKRYRRRWISVPNKNCELISNIILNYGKAHQLPVWDMFGATGGKNSARIWLKNHLMRPEKYHFTRQGYIMQGELFFNSFIQGYNHYVAGRQ